MVKYQPLNPANRAHLSAIVSIWNAACGRDLSITIRFAVYDVRPPTGAVQAGQIAVEDGAMVGFVLCSALPSDPATSPPDIGWIDAIAVSPEVQHQGVGGKLLMWAENWLREQKCAWMRLGGSLRPFIAGYPIELENDTFFRRRGFQARADGEFVWDVARDLGEYETLRRNDEVETFRRTVSTAPVIRPAQDGEEKALLEFLQREFPNRWRFEFQEYLQSGGRISDWIVLLAGRGVDGFARITLEDSVQPLDRVFPHRLPRPWGQLGPIGVAQELRGKGYGAALLEVGLAYLRTHGVRGCVIDWTNLLDFYGKFGFKPYRQYAVLLKPIEFSVRL